MPDPTIKTQNARKDENRDPLTGEPGSHPVGTGVGAAAAGAAGAALGSVVGPVGTAVGAVVGAIAGGLAGKGVAEMIDPTAEDAYWREHHREQPFATKDRPYEHFAPAYRAGYRGYRDDVPFEEREADVRRHYQAASVLEANPSSPVAKPPMGAEPAIPQGREWEQVKPAARAAYERVRSTHGGRGSSTTGS